MSNLPKSFAVSYLANLVPIRHRGHFMAKPAARHPVCRAEELPAPPAAHDVGNCSTLVQGRARRKCLTFSFKLSCDHKALMQLRYLVCGGAGTAVAPHSPDPQSGAREQPARPLVLCGWEGWQQ
jgi:hypothetical protein